MDNTEEKNYPPRLYGLGKAPTRERSLNHGSYIHYLLKAKDGLGDDVWAVLKNSSVGSIINLAENKFIWCGKTVHYFLTHQLEIKRPKEMWCLIGDEPLRFSLHEFSQLTGLNCGPYDIEDKLHVDHEPLWDKMGVPIGDGPHWKDLDKVLKICYSWSFEERRTLGFLCVISLGIFGFQRGCRMELKYAKKAFDPNVFNRFQWGRLSFDILIKSIKEANLSYKSITLKGFVHAVLIWSFEAFKKLGDMYGNKIEAEGVPLARWGGSRERYDIDDIVVKAKKEEDPVRVINLIIMPVAEIYPLWPDDVDDVRLDTLIKDILNRRLNKKAWGKKGVLDSFHKKTMDSAMLEVRMLYLCPGK